MKSCLQICTYKCTSFPKTLLHCFGHSGLFFFEYHFSFEANPDSILNPDELLRNPHLNFPMECYALVQTIGKINIIEPER